MTTLGQHPTENGLVAQTGERQRIARHPNARVPASTERLRASAHGAFHEVLSGGPAALDAAFDVYEKENTALKRKLALQAEVLKLLRGYATDCWLRTMAGRALDADEGDLRRCMPDFLFDPSIADKNEPYNA